MVCFSFSSECHFRLYTFWIRLPIVKAPSINSRWSRPPLASAGCSKLLISAGVVRIVFADAYPDPISAELLAEAGVALEPFTGNPLRELT